jgi:transposase
VKNDARDAEAICEAASRPQMRFLPVKSPTQQSVLVLHRMRTGYVEERTALINRLRGLLAEFGLFFPHRINQLHKYFVDCVEDGSNELAGPAREALMRAWVQWQALDQEIAWFDQQIAEHANQDTQATRCMEMCGVGPLTASATVATVVDARQFRNGRQLAAWIGMVPKQNSSGGKRRLGRITKQGNDYLRTLLVLGARSAIAAAARRDDRLSRWIVQLQARIGYQKTLVAVANKHARILWAILAKGEKFDPSSTALIQVRQNKLLELLFTQFRGNSSSRLVFRHIECQSDGILHSSLVFEPILARCAFERKFRSEKTCNQLI